ncbi:MAG: hypothetical protein ACLFP4_15860 [Spirochaetales bacterium]
MRDHVLEERDIDLSTPGLKAQIIKPATTRMPTVVAAAMTIVWSVLFMVE